MDVYINYSYDIFINRFILDRLQLATDLLLLKAQGKIWPFFPFFSHN